MFVFDSDMVRFIFQISHYIKLCTFLCSVWHNKKADESLIKMSLTK